MIESSITDVVSKKEEKRMPTHHDTSDTHQQQRAEFSGGACILRTTLHCSLISTCLLENVAPFSVYRRGHHVAVNYAKVSRICIRRDAFTAAAQASAIATLSSGWILPQTSSLAEAPLPQVPTVQLGTLKITRTIQGQWQLAGGHGPISESQALENMKAHLDAGISTLDTADIYGPSELIVGKFVKSQPKEAIPCTKFCCFRYLEEINRAEVRLRIQKVSDARNGKKRVFLYIVFMVLSINCIGM